MNISPYYLHTTPPPEKVRPTVVRSLPCISLGKKIAQARCMCPRFDVHECSNGLGNVTRADQCETCPQYEADDSTQGISQ